MYLVHFRRQKRISNIWSKLTSSSPKYYSTITEGEGFSKRIYLLNEGKKISPWHNIKLRPEGTSSDIFAAWFEISFLNIAKMEVATKEEFNPIKQDTNKSRHTGEKQLRYYAKFPFFNYGMLPQTWENGSLVDKATKAKGDNDPLDIWELGTIPFTTGSVVNVKILGALCLLDQDELDWKILVLNESECNKLKIRDYKDYNEAFPHKIDGIREWFRTIKTHDGKKENKFGYKEEVRLLLH